MSDEKPFLCTVPGCGQRFTNEDHLAVHRHKHEMTLKLGPARGDSLVLADQTPTPTRFLKNCDEVGLFHELTGPLEQDFRKEEELRKLPLDLSPLARGPIHTCPEESSTGESLHLSPTTHPESTTGSVEGSSVPLPPVLCPASLQIPSVLLASPDANTAVSPSKTTVPVSSSFPLLLQLPSGQTMPVALSASIANIPAALPIARPIAMVPGVPGPSSPQPVQSEAKMVTSQESVDAPSPMPPEEPVVQSLQQPATSTTETAEVSPPAPARRMPSTGGRRRRAASEDPDEKRRRFLERNRAAASRCRQKRKVWVQALEKKAEDLDSLNSQLQSEVTKLRTEVAQLKQLLLAHKDCPVTAMLRKTCYHNEDEEAVSAARSPLAEAVQHSSISTSNGISPQVELPAEIPATRS